jgi:hypothetical protein
MIWKSLDNGEDNVSIFEKIYEKYNPIEFTEKKKIEISKIYKPNEVIIPYFDSKKISNQKKTTKKRGRKLKNEICIIRPRERIHSRLNSDNIKRKIKTHFHCFIISFLNLTIKKEYDGVQKFTFKKMNSEVTQNISIKYNKNLLLKPIKEILKNVSLKYNDSSQNIKIISKIPSSKIEINKLLNCTYQQMYEDYYLKSKSEMFQNEIENNSYENHLLRIFNKFGKEYTMKYKDNADKFMEFFCNNKGRGKNTETEFNKNLNKETVSNINNLNLKFKILNEEQ